MSEESGIKVLFILPHHDFFDGEFTDTKKILEEQGIHTEVCSTHFSEAQGRFKTLVEPDCVVREVETDDYDAFVFIGGDGAKEFYHDFEIQDMIRNLIRDKKVIMMFGEAVVSLYYAGVINSRRVTCQENLKQQVEAGGAYFTGKAIEQDGDLITAYDDRSTLEAAKALVRAIGWQKDHKGYI